MLVNQAIFKQYDLRGIYQTELTDKTAYLIGQAYATFIQQQKVKQITVGRDNRLSSPALTKNLIKGLLSAGCEVTDIGLTLTPIIDFSWYQLSSPATIMVTASHCPKNYNGFKLALKKTLVFGNDIQKLYQLILKKQFTVGKGQLIHHSINADYIKHLQTSVNLKRKLNIAIDCANGTASLIAPKIFNQLNLNLTPLYCTSDGSFPHHEPYPQKHHQYTKLTQTINTKKLDLGIAFDGDGDRMGIYNEKGNYVQTDQIFYLHAQALLKTHPQATFVVNVATSQTVINAIKKLGGKVIISRTGPPHFLPLIKKHRALLGGELSGHLAFNDRYFGFDDGLYSALRTIELISQTSKPLSALLKGLPTTFSTPEFRVFGGDKKFTAVKNIHQILKKDKRFKLLTIDGLRVTTKNGWFLLRTSQTEPLVTGRAETDTQKNLLLIKNLIKTLLKQQHINLDWQNPIDQH